jgi:putative endonuclease
MRNYILYVYILTNKSGTLYTGISKDAEMRQWQHENKIHNGFTAKYNIDKLIYYEEYQYRRSHTQRKTNKELDRQKKLALIRKTNPRFEDLLKSKSVV